MLRLKLCWHKIAQRFQYALLVELGDPFQRRHFPVFEAPPRSVRMDHFGLEQSDDRFGERVVIGIANAAHQGAGRTAAKRPVYRIERNCEPRFEWTSRCPSSRRRARPAQRIEHQIGLHRGVRAPADDATREHVDEECDVHQAAPRRDVRAVRDPQLMRAFGVELPLY